MPKNFFRKIKESMIPTNTDGGRDDKSHDFERAKDVLFSAKNLEQLVSAVKYINNFNKKHKIRETSPEFIYFDKMINVMKIKLRSRKREVGNDSEDSERMDLRGRIRESLDDMDWIKDTQPTKLDFNFDEKEYWVDVSKIDIEDRQKIVDYIKKTVPNFEEFGGGELDDTYRGLNQGIIIHCGSDRTDYEPEENLICYSNVSYEEDYETLNPNADISKSIYVNGQEILDYLSVISDEEELEESLEWTDKDVPFDEKDKSFEADPTWTDDVDWKTNPERSYWKQGDAGGSGGDMNESQDLDWMKGDYEKASPSDRPRVDAEEFLLDYAEDNLEIIDILSDEDMYVPTNDYKRRYTEEEWEDYGEDRWRDSDFREHGEWIEYPFIGNWDMIEQLEMGCSKWKFIERTTGSYDLETGSFTDLYIFERKKDGKYFALAVEGDSYNGFMDNLDYLYEVFPQMKLVYESESEWDWAKEIPGTKEYGEEYRYFEVVACYGFDYETEECDDEYSHFVKIPKYEADVIWDRWVGYFGGPGDEALGIIGYVIKNQLISRHELEEIVAFEGVREISEEDMEEEDEMDIEFVDEEENINESDWDWLEDTKEHANYNGNPQGIVKIYDHDEIDRIVDIIDNYNGFPSTTDRINIHQGLEDRRDELEELSEGGEDYGEAVLSVSFFVEKERRGFGPNALTLGYWPYEVDERGINEWLGHELTYNKEYELYEDIEQVEQAFKQFQN